MSFILGANADFLFPVSSPVSVSSVSVLTVQELSPATIVGSVREPFFGLQGSSVVFEVPTTDESLLQSRLVELTQKLDLDPSLVDIDYEESVIVSGSSLSDSFQTLVEKLDTDTASGDDYSSVSGVSFVAKFNALLEKLDSDTHIAFSDYSDLLIPETQSIPIVFDRDYRTAIEVSEAIQDSAGSNLEVSSKNGFVLVKSVGTGATASVSCIVGNNALGFTTGDFYGHAHQLISVSCDISVVMVTPKLSAVSVHLDRNLFNLNKSYFIVMDDGVSQQIERITIVRQRLGQVEFV